MKVVNLFGGPGAGKSTTASALFVHFKNQGLRVELVGEEAKDWVYQGRINDFQNQFLLSASQYARLKRLENSKCELAISDSPLVGGLAYSLGLPYYQELQTIVRKVNKEFENLNVWVERTKFYSGFGRNQATLAEAKEFDRKMKPLGEPYNLVVTGDAAGQKKLANLIEQLYSQGFGLL